MLVAPAPQRAIVEIDQKAADRPVESRKREEAAREREEAKKREEDAANVARRGDAASARLTSPLTARYFATRAYTIGAVAKW